MMQHLSDRTSGAGPDGELWVGFSFEKASDDVSLKKPTYIRTNDFTAAF